MFSESVGRRKWRRAGEQALMAVPGPRIWPDCAVGGRREWGQTGAQALGGKWPAAERGGANQVEAWGREGPAAWVLPLGEPGGDGVALDGCGRSGMALVTASRGRSCAAGVGKNGGCLAHLNVQVNASVQITWPNDWNAPPVMLDL